MDKFIQDICTYYNVAPTDIGRKKWGNIPEFTYSEIISRLLLTNSAMIDAFPEMSKTTISTLLCKLFPGKTKQNQEWGNYLLGLINSRKCPACLKIQDLSEFTYYPSRDAYKNCKNCDYFQRAEYRLANKEKVRLLKQQSYLRNKDKVRKYQKEYYLSHKAEFMGRAFRRFIRLRRATPPWADMNIMNEIYASRKDGEHTDHIIPLRGKLVSGLHNHFNLRNIPAAENLSKSNKFDPDTYIHELP